MKDLPRQLKYVKELVEQAWRDVCELATKVRTLESVGARQRTPSDSSRTNGAKPPPLPQPSAGPNAGGASPSGTFQTPSLDCFARSVSSVQTVRVEDAHTRGPALPSGVQTPAGSEAVLAQALALYAAGGSKHKEADKIELCPLPSASGFANWMIQSSRRVANATHRSDDALPWVLAVQKPGATFESLADSGAFSTLDGKLFIALEEKIKPPLSHKVQLIQRELSGRDLLMKGRQLLWMICQHFKVSSTDARMNDYRLFHALAMRNNSLALFVHEWDQCLMKMQVRPEEDAMLSAFYDQVSSHASIRHDIFIFDRLPADDPKRTYEGLRAMVGAQLERDRSDKVRQEFLSRKGPAGVGADKPKPKNQSSDAPPSVCFQWWKTGNCSRDKCNYAHVGSP